MINDNTILSDCHSDSSVSKPTFMSVINLFYQCFYLSIFIFLLKHFLMIIKLPLSIDVQSSKTARSNSRLNSSMILVFSLPELRRPTFLGLQSQRAISRFPKAVLPRGSVVCRIFFSYVCNRSLFLVFLWIYFLNLKYQIFRNSFAN